MLHRAAALLLPLLLLAAPSARAQSGGGASPDIRSFSVNVLQGFGFDDPLTGNETKSERMLTVTLEGFTTFPFGDSFFFTDLTSGNFTGGPDRTEYRAYLEWQPRLSSWSGARAPNRHCFARPWRRLRSRGRSAPRPAS